LNAYKNLIILILLSLAAALLLYEGVKRVSFKPSLLPQEQELVGLSFERVNVQQREPDIVSGRESPFGGPSAPKKEFPAVPLPQLLGQPSPVEKSVSLILIKDGQRMAIVNNQVVREGDLVGKGRVLKIEIDKVLIREDGTDRWFPLDQEGSRTRQENKVAGGKASGPEKLNPGPGRGNIVETAKADKDRIPKQVEETEK
jgi:hypothetical protein